jgi:thioredoxin-dependent peroxiredoxin
VHAGDQVRDFELFDENGVSRRLSELAHNGPVVLFFYPGAMTYGCTRESCHFRDLNGEFQALGAQPVGISTDPVSKQKQFSDLHSFPFPLLSDVGGVVAEQFGVRRRISLLGTRRSTFVIDPDLRVLEVIRSEVSMSAHADKALEVLRSRAATA